MQPTRLEIKFSHDAEDYKVIVDVETYVKALPFNPMSFDPPDEGELEYDVVRFLVEVDDDLPSVNGYVEVISTTVEDLIGVGELDTMVIEHYEESAMEIEE